MCSRFEPVVIQRHSVQLGRHCDVVCFCGQAPNTEGEIPLEDRVIYEYRQNGQLRMIRIVPGIGKPYYLVPRDETRGYGDLERADMLIPRWTIIEF